MQDKKRYEIRKGILIFISIFILISTINTISATKLPTVGGDSGAWGTILNEFLNVSHNGSGELRSDIVFSSQIVNGTITDTDISDITNLTLGEKITFTFGEIIDNIVNGWIKITGGLNVTQNFTVGSSALFVDSSSGNVGIGTTNPERKLDVDGIIRAKNNYVGSDTGFRVSGTSVIDSLRNLLNINNATISYNLIVDTNTFVVNSTTHKVGIGTTNPSATLNVVGDANISMSNSGDQIFISQSSATGTEDQPLVFIDDDRTGTTSDEIGEAALVIDAEGYYALYVMDGNTWFAGGGNYFGTSVYILGNQMINIGSVYSVTGDTNGAGDTFLRWYYYDGTFDTAAIFMIEGEDPNDMIDHDDYESPTFVMANKEGADARDYAAVVIGERAQADVKTTHYFDFYAMIGSADGSVDPTNTEIAATFRFGDNGSTIPTASLGSGDVLFEDDIEVVGTAYFDGNVGINTTDPTAALDVNGITRLGNYVSKPTCDANAAGGLVFDTTEVKPYVCNGSTWKPLDSDYDSDGITDAIDTDDTNPNDATAVAADVLSSETFYAGGESRTGSMTNVGQQTITPTTSNQAITAGYHDGTGYCDGDTDLVSGNIKSSINIFGVDGNSNVVDTSGGNIDSTARIRSGYTCYSDGSSYSGSLANCANGNNACYANGGYWASAACGEGGSSCWASGGKWYASECQNIGAETTCYIDDTTRYVYGEARTLFPATGQTTSYATGDDGYWEKGAAKSYTDNGDGTTTDDNTGLMWCDDGNSACAYSGGLRTWSQALTVCNDLTFATHSDWRLPNVYELYSIVLLEPNGAPYVDTAYFTNIATDRWYITSTVRPDDPTSYALIIYFQTGAGGSVTQWVDSDVLCVRGGSS